jgi:hypothetical protein
VITLSFPVMQLSFRGETQKWVSNFILIPKVCLSWIRLKLSKTFFRKKKLLFASYVISEIFYTIRKNSKQPLLTKNNNEMFFITIMNYKKAVAVNTFLEQLRSKFTTPRNVASKCDNKMGKQILTSKIGWRRDQSPF